MNATIKRLASGLLVASMTVGLFPIYAAADTGLCEHHTEHADCGYAAAFAGEDCTHAHDDGCYTEVTDCVHVHGDCGYVPAMEGASCDHTHDESCGFSEGTPAQGQCSHVCSCESGCIRKELSCSHVHDETCGYKAAVEGKPCTFECEQCLLRNEGQPVCTCEVKCSGDGIKAECPVCSAEGADLSLCTGKTEESQRVPVTEEIASFTVHAAPDPGLPDHQELFRSFAEQVFYGYQFSTYAATTGDTLNAGERGLYDALKPLLENTALNGGSTKFLLDSIENTKTQWTTEELRELGVNTDDDQAVTAYFEKEYIDAVAYNVLLALMADMPFHMYWYDKAVGAQFIGKVYRTGYTEDGATIYTHVGVKLSAEFPVSVDYQKDGDLYFVDDRENGSMGRVKKARANADRVVASAQGKTDLEKVNFFKTYICDSVSYDENATGAAYGDSFQMIAVFDDDPNTNVVCEGYAKAFQYLCELSGIPCISVQGGCGEIDSVAGHMWNVVTLEGKNYLADINNCDTDFVGYPDKLFLVGGDFIEDLNIGDYYQDQDGYKGGYKYTIGPSEAYYVSADLNLVPGYRATTQVTGDGAITLSNSSPSYKELVEITVKPGADPYLRALTVTDESGNALELIKYNDTDYAFKMPRSDVTVHGEFASIHTKLVTTYEYNSSSGDPHSQYPVSMKVEEIVYDGATETRRTLSGFDNILQYSGSSIRITGVNGIRMITSIPTDRRSELMAGGIEGYTLLEYGTVVCWASDLEAEEMDGEALTLSFYAAKKNHAYKKDVADPIFAEADGLTQYTNVLTNFTDEQCKNDLVMRPYMKLQDPDGYTHTVYGGAVQRSIGYIAWQNRNDFAPGSEAYAYVWDIIHAVYGELYDAEYKAA